MCAYTNNNREMQPQDEESLPITPHDIFLSHSGVQKGFVNGLYDMISPLYSAFLDITNHSLPLAENFPAHIFYAAKNCKLAVVVLSEEYVSSKWPMLELSAFVEAMPSVRVLPLFYSLSPADIRNADNLVRWREKWETFAVHDSRIDVCVWADALRKVCSNNGLAFDPSEGEVKFSEKIVSWIYKSVPLTIKRNDSGIFGKDRLCEVILSKFKEMESRAHESKDSQPKFCVLGMYGFPGSGKSTLSRFLQEHFFPLYAGRALYLQLPTSPSPTDLINIFMELLRVTDFRQRTSLDQVSDLRMVYSLLKKLKLQELPVFVVVDNISDKSVKAVKEFLELVGVGPGSKVLLVARTLDVLQPALQLLGKKDECFVSDSICVPRISEAEAAGILLHTLGVESTDVTPSQSVVDVVRMCGFGSRQYDLLYLPLVMETMGSLLTRFEGDVEKWGNVLSRFRKNRKTYKEDVVKELIKSSFKELGDEELQLLFLDVTLFIVPLELCVQEAYDLLSILHACSPERVETRIKDLQRHCFLRITDRDEITVHDVYIEFAESIQEDRNFRLSSSCRRWSWMQYKPSTAAVMGRELLLRQDHTTSDDEQVVRTMIVEVEGGCERVELNGYTGLKALVVRNCPSLAALALAGLTSLVSIDIQNCPCMQRLHSADCDYSKVKRLQYVQSCTAKEEEKSTTASTLQVQQYWRQLPLIAVHSSIVGLQKVIAAIMSRRSSPPRFFEGISTQMRALQVLRLEHTGIRRLVNLSSCWPQLRELYVEEYHLEAFEIGSLRKLNRFHIQDHEGRSDQEDWGLCDGHGKYPSFVECKNDLRRYNPKGMELMKECPELEDVVLRSAFLDVSALAPKVRSLEVQMLSALKLPDLTLAAPSLEELTVHLCGKLERVDFFVKFERLTILELERCRSLVEVTGLCFLHNLRIFVVDKCPKLQVLGGFNNLRMLEDFEVAYCRELRKISDLSGLTSLDMLTVMHCQKLREISDLSGLTNLKTLSVTFCPELRSLTLNMGLTSLGTLELTDCPNITVSGFSNTQLEGMFDTAGMESTHVAKLQELSSYGEKIAVQSSHGGTVQLQSNLSSAQQLGGTVIPFCSLRSIFFLELGQISDLVTLDGIEHLYCTLNHLHLQGLPELRNVQRLESLIHLWSLTLAECPQLEELPPLHGLVELRDLVVVDCGKLRAVEISLERVWIVGCRSLACFVFRDLAGLLRLQRGHMPDLHDFLSIEGCTFASIEAMVEWAFDAHVPESLRRASCEGLAWEYKENGRKLQVVEAFFPKLCSMLGGVPLLQQFEMDIEYRLSILDILDILDTHLDMSFIFEVENWRETLEDAEDVCVDQDICWEDVLLENNL